jgi:hypothetical protein
MKDRIAFEHELFQLISQDFPFLEHLCICNDYPQKDKKHSSIKFPYFTFLDLELAHVDYAELFLLKKKYASISFDYSYYAIQITHNGNRQFYH